MKLIYKLLLLPLVALALSCNASDKQEMSADTAKSLIRHFLGSQVKVADNQPFFQIGDFNGDGYKDMAVLFQPEGKPRVSKQVSVTTPWVYPGVPPMKLYGKSLAIFNGSNSPWLSDGTRVYVLLDTAGALETPSFELLVSKKIDDDYKHHVSMLPAQSVHDLIIIPTEAGIDTYIYWDKAGYVLYESQEMP